MASQGPLGCNDNFTTAAEGSNDWISPDGALTAEGGGSMSATMAGGTYRVKTSNHGFSLGAGVTSIDGIMVEWRLKDSCLAEGTMVRLSNGHDASIESLEIGDEIISFNNDMSTINVKVKSTTRMLQKEYYLITTTKRVPTEYEKHGKIEDFFPERTIKATAEHPFFSIDKQFIKVKNLKVGMELWTSNTRIDHEHNDLWFQEYYPEEILSIELIQEPIYVYDIIVDEPNTFIANTFWVHNKTLGLLFDVSAYVEKAGVDSSSNLATGDNPGIDSSGFNYIVYGGSTELWGETWTQSDIEDAAFGASWSGSGTKNSFVMDYMRITVYYTATTPSGTVRKIQTTTRTLTGVGL